MEAPNYVAISTYQVMHREGAGSSIGCTDQAFIKKGSAVADPFFISPVSLILTSIFGVAWGFYFRPFGFMLHEAAYSSQ